MGSQREWLGAMLRSAEDDWKGVFAVRERTLLSAVCRGHFVCHHHVAPRFIAKGNTAYTLCI
jgi:hypothetical protein